MKIAGTEYFTGVYNRRIEAKLGINLKKSYDKEIEKILERGQKVVDSLLLSDEGKKLSAEKAQKGTVGNGEGKKEDGSIDFPESGKMDIYEILLRQQKEVAAGREATDEFWENPTNQWLNFTKYLDQHGFYENRSDEDVKKFENLLSEITNGMDFLTGLQFNTGFIDVRGSFHSGPRPYMSKAEAIASLESSTNALSYLAEKLLPDDQKEGFSKLIDLYKSHNEKIIEDYKNPFEGIERAIELSIEKRKDYFGSSLKPVEEAKYQSMKAKITKTDKAYKDYWKAISEEFRRYNESQDDTILKSVKEIYLNFVTDNTKDVNFRNYMMKKAKNTFSHIEHCWKRILEKA